MTQALTTTSAVDPKKRSVVTFQMNGDPWPTIAAWAKQYKFNPREPQTGNVKVFQKGSGFWTAPCRAQFTQNGSTIELQAYLSIGLLARIGALFLLPPEMHINSGGFKAVVPRNSARKAVNVLLQQVGATPIP
jgi:hypothetical protein